MVPMQGPRYNEVPLYPFVYIMHEFHVVFLFYNFTFILSDSIMLR